MAKMTETMQEASTYDDLKPYVKQLEAKLGWCAKVLSRLIPMAMAGDYESFLADATIFMDMASTVVVAYQWIKNGHRRQKSFGDRQRHAGDQLYESKIHTMKYYFKYELPRVNACMDTLMNEEELTIVQEKQEVFR